MRNNLVMFSKISFSLDGLIEEHAENDEEKAVEDAKYGKTTLFWISFGS